MVLAYISIGTSLSEWFQTVKTLKVTETFSESVSCQRLPNGKSPKIAFLYEKVQTHQRNINTANVGEGRLPG
jgi:hypothetical protein